MERIVSYVQYGWIVTVNTESTVLHKWLEQAPYTKLQRRPHTHSAFWFSIRKEMTPRKEKTSIPAIATLNP